MRDVRLAQLAAAQFNRVSRSQLTELGLSNTAISHRVANGRLVTVEQGVFALAPVLEEDDWGRWTAATLTAPGSVLSHASAAAARSFWSLPRQFETVTREGSGGPRRHGGVLVFRSSTLTGDSELLRGVPITTVPRTLLDLAGHVSTRALARAVREAVRLESRRQRCSPTTSDVTVGAAESAVSPPPWRATRACPSSERAAVPRCGRWRCCASRTARSRG